MESVEKYDGQSSRGGLNWTINSFWKARKCEWVFLL